MTDTVSREAIERILAAEWHSKALHQEWSQVHHDTINRIEDAIRALPATPSVNADVEAFWFAVENGWDIEPRKYFEAEAPKNGFGSPLAMAVHYMWKRERKAPSVNVRAAAEELARWANGDGEYDDVTLKIMADSNEKIILKHLSTTPTERNED